MVNRIHFPTVNAHSRFCNMPLCRALVLFFYMGTCFLKMTLGLSNVQIFVLGSPIPFLSLTLTVTLALTLCSAKIKNNSTLLGITISFTVLGCEVHWYNIVLVLVISMWDTAVLLGNRIRFPLQWKYNGIC